MQKSEIRLNYQQATQLVQVGRYDDALEILVELNDVKPNTENILYLMAVCQAKAGKENEALELCERLIQEFDHPRAKEIMKHLSVPSSPRGHAHKKSDPSQTKQKMPDDASRTDKQNEQEGTPSSAISEPPQDEKIADATDDVSEKSNMVKDKPTEAVDSATSKESTGDQKDDAATTEEETAPVPEQQPEEQKTVPRVEKQQETEIVPDEVENEETASPMRRPLWLVLLWSATLALIAAYMLYIYVLDPMLNPF